jgi:hypothetical protein
MQLSDIKPNVIVQGPIFPERVKVITTVLLGDSIKLIGEGMETGKVHQPILNEDQIAQLEVSSEKEPFDGDPVKFRLGIEAIRLGLAYEYDPYFSLSIARVDPLPHQLEAVYDYFLKLPRIRFLLADDPGAGKTIMAGLLIKELVSFKSVYMGIFYDFFIAQIQLLLMSTGQQKSFLCENVTEPLRVNILKCKHF